MVKLLVTILSILGLLVRTTYGYSCQYINRRGVLIYVHCPYSECCGHYNYRYCCSYYNVGAIVGGVFGLLIFIGLIAGCVSCFFCACCPVYKRRRQGYVITRTVPNYSSTTVGAANVSSQPYRSIVVTRTPDGIQTSPPPPPPKYQA